MLEKTTNLLLAILGLAVVAAIVLLGFDVYRSAKTGPRWKRRLVGAALALLAALGLPACDKATDASPPATGNAGTPSTTLADSPQWKRLVATWHEAEEIASGRRGAYPFDRAGKKRVLQALATAGKDVDALRRAGLLSDAEAGLLDMDLAQLTRGVQAKRPTEMRMATCYESMAYTSTRNSMKRLSARLPLLEKLTTAAKLQRDVARKVLVSIESDLATLAKKEMIQRLPEADRARAEELRRAVEAHVEKLKAALSGKKPGGRLESSWDWEAISDAWATAVPLAKSGRSTTAQRKEAEKKLAAATEAARRLAAAGTLAPQEAELLAAEAKYIRQDVYCNPPTDSRVSCYDMMYIPPAHKSFRRLARRLPLVEKLVTGGKVHQGACARIIAAIEADLAVLSDAKQLGKLPEAERKKAEATREQVREALRRLNRLLVPPRTCYVPLRVPDRKPQSQRQLDDRLKRVQALEREGRLQPVLAALLREAIDRERATERHG